MEKTKKIIYVNIRNFTLLQSMFNLLNPLKKTYVYRLYRKLRRFFSHRETFTFISFQRFYKNSPNTLGQPLCVVDECVAVNQWRVGSNPRMDFCEFRKKKQFVRRCASFQKNS